MKRPVVLIVAAAAGALVVAGVGASAHSLSLTRLTGAHSSVFGDEASGARTESPEPTDKPEAPATAEPTEAPEAPKTTATEPPDTETGDTETGDNEGDNNSQGGSQSGSGDEHGGD